MPVTLVPHAVAAILGALHARADERYRLMSRAIMTMLALRIGHAVAQATRPGTAERIARYAAGLPVAPYAGLARATWAVEQALVLSWYAALSWAVWQALKDESPGSPRGLATDRRIQPAAVPYLLTRGSPLRFGLGTIPALTLLASSVLLFAAYPIARGRPVELASTVVFAAALAIQLAAATRYVLRWRQPDAAQGVALVLVAGSVADAAGPWLFASPARDWTTGEPIGVLIWGVVGGVELLWAIAKTREP